MQEIYRANFAKEYPVKIIYEDNHLLFVEKPAGLLAQADKSGDPDILNILKAYLKEKYDKPGAAWLGLLHRLDRMVGGLMVFAKTSKAASRMSELFRKNDLQKTYQAILRNSPEQEAGKWLDRLSSKKKAGKYYPDPQGKEAILNYRLLQGISPKDYLDKLALAEQPHLCPTLSLVQLHLVTGRPHQIRVQSSSRNLPILGDRRYGPHDSLNNAIPEPALYATALEFIHPVRKEPLKVSIDLPEILPWSLFRKDYP